MIPQYTPLSPPRSEPHRDGWVYYEEKIDGWSAATRGYVAKDEECFYVGGRTRAWLKVKVPGVD